jgi:DNA mismatch repair ATPase MutS
VQVQSSISDSLIKLINTIGITLDLPASKDNNKITVKAGINAELDELRSHYAGFDELLDVIGKEELKRYSNITSLRIMYFPQIGFQLAIPVQDQVALPGFNFQVKKSTIGISTKSF